MPDMNTMSSGEHDTTDSGSDMSAAKIQALREMIQNAERTIHGAKAMLLQLEGKKKTGRPRKFDADASGGTVIQGAFDGQFMTGSDGKQYPVPANYASKSKLVEGDLLKLTITPDGSFIYKQIGPVERRHVIGIVVQDEHGNYQIVAEGRTYRILLASVTYFKLEPGDEVSILIPRDEDAVFAALEHVLQKGAMVSDDILATAKAAKTAGEERMGEWKDTFNGSVPDPGTAGGFVSNTQEPTIETVSTETGDENVLEQWIRDMEALEKEETEKTAAQQQ